MLHKVRDCYYVNMGKGCDSATGTPLCCRCQSWQRELALSPPSHTSPWGVSPLVFLHVSFFRADGSVAWGRRDGICSGSLLLHVNSFELSVNRTIVLRDRVLVTYHLLQTLTPAFTSRVTLRKPLSHSLAHLAV